MSKPTVGIFGLTGCGGDQLVILNCEDELLALAGLLDLRDFLTASSRNDTASDLDLALVEGAVVTRRDEAALLRIRQRARTLAAIGTCAVWGGPAAADKHALDQLVKVDLSLTGCPIEKEQLLALVASVLHGDVPVFPRAPVCAECRMRESNCLLAERGEFCCGPLTAGGCGARCPALNVACVGCRGPSEDANLAGAFAMFAEKGIARDDLARKLGIFAPPAGGQA